MKSNTYNPDVLNCLANLSNDEVFTPPTLANQVLDLLPQELFTSPTTRFLDPVSKSGVFLREIVKRLDRGLTPQMPDRRQRIDHILRKQVFGIAITELTAHLSRRSVYCSKDASSEYSVTRFKTKSGNILYRPLRHTWANGKCRYCGASQEVYDRGDQAEQYAYQFIHTDNPHTLFNNMKFDVIIGNPPYQLSDGGGMQTESSSGSAIPLYQKFVEQAKKLNPRFLIMIIPARWFSGGRGLDEFRDTMLKDSHLSTLVDFSDSRDCFPGVDIAGGVCYFLWERGYKGLCNITNIYGGKRYTKERKLDEFPVFVRYSICVDIIKKVLLKKERLMSNVVYSSKPFGFRSFETGRKTNFPASIELLGSKGISYVSEKEVSINKNLVGKWKVIMSKASAEHAGQTDKDGRKRIVSKVEVLPPNTICSESYLLLSVFDDEQKANNLRDYVKTNFFRFLLSTILLTQNIAKDKFQFVPLQDFSHPWTDAMLYKKYGLTDEEISFIESMIRPME
ncbi:MAG: Eco57I restriction-modification methylase domain-containing protein [Bacteroidaceae bacterium]|nr:Eco57I restriction-modification methylase domain-containing protein [Bacteroidaceae bacterium]